MGLRALPLLYAYSYTRVCEMSNYKSKTIGLTESERIVKAFNQIWKAQTAKRLIVNGSQDKTDSKLAEPGLGQAVSVQHMTLLFADCMEDLKKMQKGYKHKTFPGR